MSELDGPAVAPLEPTEQPNSRFAAVMTGVPRVW